MTKNEETEPVDLKELKQLREENARLKALLSRHSISWQEEPPAAEAGKSENSGQAHTQLSPPEKVALFRRMFRGRDNVYPLRWKSAKGRAGYSPACGNEWKPGLCNKRETKCSDCPNRLLLPVTDQVIYDHLAGKSTVGVYPLLDDNSCYFLAVDFDKGEWQEDSRAFMQSCLELDIPAALEVSRSGNGAHIWIFFAEPVLAREARQLGMALISYTCDRIRQLSLASYDRFFPNQDTMPKGGFGNLIALPLQKQPREKGYSVFVDGHFSPYPDQWAFLASVQPISKSALESAILQASGGRHPLDVSFVAAEDEESKPWQRPQAIAHKIAGTLPESVCLVLANQIFVNKFDLPQPLANRLIRLAAFQNPEFYKAQAMRFSVWDKPRIISCAENFSHHFGLPRGCLSAVLEVLEVNTIKAEIQDERLTGCKVPAKFIGKLRKDQKVAVREMMRHEIGVLCAPTAFGKTVTAAKLIARRKRSTLILVHRTELLNQWLERLNTFLELPEDSLGAIGGGMKKLTGKIDIAVMQSLSRREDLAELLDKYGQIIVDECHHLSAFSFEAILKQAKAQYVLGLTATPIRRDGHQPIIFMQCGPLRHSAKTPENIPKHLEVRPQYLAAPVIPPGSTIQDIFRIIANDFYRNQHIAKDVRAAYSEGRKVLVLTERTDHLKFLREAIGTDIEHLFVLHGRLSKKQRAAILASLAELAGTAPRVLLATGRLVGEGFDHPPLDTLVLAMPISWKGTLQQYAGRLHREHGDKQDVRIYDYVEKDQPQLARMWNKRQRGYRAMGYQVNSEALMQTPVSRGA
ncbi:MAG: DEAD/DEAH box helicase [Desulfobulbaceae bacterium]|nr:MAG: DEAD/DEAH box helicase [Desulfobulbaceae bacterium]